MKTPNIDIRITFNSEALQALVATAASNMMFSTPTDCGHWEVDFNNKSYDPAFTARWVEDPAIEAAPIAPAPQEALNAF